MKTKYIIVLGFLIVLLSAETVEETDCDEIQNPTKKKDCNGKLSTSDKNENYKYCCYFESDEGKVCLAYTQEDYDEIGDHKKYYKKAGIKIECFSSYLSLGFLLLISLVSLL